MPNPEYLSFEDLEALAKEFKAGLESLGIDVEKGTTLGDILALVLELPTRRKNIQSMSLSEDIRPEWRSILAVRRLALKFVRLYVRPGFDVMAAHLKLLNKGKLAENRYDRSEEGNKVFELLFALLAFEVGTNLVLDPPINAKSKKRKKKVDILFTYQGERWAIECKVPNGSAESLLNLIDKGVEQIQESDATIGVVAISARNILQHDVFWRKEEDGSYPPWEKEEAQAIMECCASVVAEVVRKVRPPEVWESRLVGKKTLTQLLGYFESACGVIHNGKPTVASYGLMSQINLATTAQAAPALFEALNRAMHDRF